MPALTTLRAIVVMAKAASPRGAGSAVAVVAAGTGVSGVVAAVMPVVGVVMLVSDIGGSPCPDRPAAGQPGSIASLRGAERTAVRSVREHPVRADRRSGDGPAVCRGRRLGDASPGLRGDPSPQALPVSRSLDLSTKSDTATRTRPRNPTPGGARAVRPRTIVRRRWGRVRRPGPTAAEETADGSSGSGGELVGHGERLVEHEEALLHLGGRAGARRDDVGAV